MTLRGRRHGLPDRTPARTAVCTPENSHGNDTSARGPDTGDVGRESGLWSAGKGLALQEPSLWSRQAVPYCANALLFPEAGLFSPPLQPAWLWPCGECRAPSVPPDLVQYLTRPESDIPRTAPSWAITAIPPSVCSRASGRMPAHLALPASGAGQLGSLGWGGACVSQQISIC